MSSKSQAPWEIPSRSRTCARANEPLAAGMAVYSELVVGPAADCHRRDFCSRCWDLEQQERDVVTVTHWRSLIPHVVAERDIRKEEQGEQMLMWLRTALARDEEDGNREAFVLALYLLRIRKLIRRHVVVRQSAPCVLYEVAETGEALLVPTVALAAAEIELLFQDLALRLRDHDVHGK